MSSIEIYQMKFCEMVEMHLAANQRSAHWMQGLMFSMSEVITQAENRRRALIRANKILRLSIERPQEHMCELPECIDEIYRRHLTRRWKWVDEEFQRSKLFKNMKSDPKLEGVASTLELSAHYISVALNAIAEYRCDISDSETVDPKDFFEVYSYRLSEKVDMFVLKETLSLSSQQRDFYRDVMDRELAFLLSELERDWTACLLENDADEIGSEEACRFQLCGKNEIQVCMESLSVAGSKLSPPEKKSLKELSDQNGIAYLAPVPDGFSQVLSDFRERFPNMGELADVIKGHLNLMTMGGLRTPLQLSSKPLILDGPAGVGKTMALRYLANALGIKYKVIGCAELTNGFDISGQSKGWSSGKMGLIARMLVCEQAANGIVVLDELDKCHDSESNFPPTQAMYTLLEKETSAHFKDEFLDFEIDASRVNWMGTSNYFDQIPEPIRDRVRRIKVSMPTIQQRVSISKYLYSDLREKNAIAWGQYFTPVLDDDVAFLIASVRGVSIRGMKDILVECLTQVADVSNGCLDPESQKINVDEASKIVGVMAPNFVSGQRIGFIH